MPLYCAEFGEPSRPAIVLLHELGMAHRMWQPQFKALAQNFHVLAPDLPGFARSADAGPFTLSGAATSVAELIRAHSGIGASVCGLSLGARVPLGTIHTPFTRLAGMPIQTVGAAGVAGWIELDPAYTAGLKDLDGFEYLILIYQLHQAGAGLLTVTPFLDD